MDVIQFDQLPYLCLKKIFGYLNLRDRVKARAVNRHFKFFADQLDELVVNLNEKGKGACACRYWQKTDRPINRKNQICPEAIQSVKTSFNQHLKFLHIHLRNTSDPDVDFNILNDLQQLIHLEIIITNKNSKLNTLVLPNLRVFEVRNGITEHPRFLLKTPKLEVLGCDVIEDIKVEYPEKIERIACSPTSRKLEEFKNLKILHILCSIYAWNLSEIRLSDLSDLKEMHFHFDSYSEKTIKWFRSSLINLMRQKSELKREEVKFYLDDVLLVNEKQVNEYKPMYTRNLFYTVYCDYFRVKYYKLLRLDSYPRVNSLDFSWFKDIELSTDFFKRFPRIVELTATNWVKED